MTILARLYDFVAGTTIHSAEVDAEFNQLVNGNNSHILSNPIEHADGSIAQVKMAVPYEWELNHTIFNSINNSLYTGVANATTMAASTPISPAAPVGSTDGILFQSIGRAFMPPHTATLAIQHRVTSSGAGATTRQARLALNSWDGANWVDSAGGIGLYNYTPWVATGDTNLIYYMINLSIGWAVPAAFLGRTIKGFVQYQYTVGAGACVFYDWGTWMRVASLI